MEQTRNHVCLIGLSATLPNYQDVATFAATRVSKLIGNSQMTEVQYAATQIIATTLEKSHGQARIPVIPTQKSCLACRSACHLYSLTLSSMARRGLGVVAGISSVPVCSSGSSSNRPEVMLIWCHVACATVHVLENMQSWFSSGAICPCIPWYIWQIWLLTNCLPRETNGISHVVTNSYHCTKFLQYAHSLFLPLSPLHCLLIRKLTVYTCI